MSPADDAAAGEAAAERDAFLGGPDDHLERMTRADVGARERLDRAERRERAEVAVEVAAARHRVDVRAEQDRRQRRLEAVAAREDVAGGIDARFEAGRAHQADDIRPAGDVRVRIGDAADAVGERAARGPAERAERLQSVAATQPDRREPVSSAQTRVGPGWQGLSLPSRDSSGRYAWTGRPSSAPQRENEAPASSHPVFGKHPLGSSLRSVGLGEGEHEQNPCLLRIEVVSRDHPHAVINIAGDDPSVAKPTRADQTTFDAAGNERTGLTQPLEDGEITGAGAGEYRITWTPLATSAWMTTVLGSVVQSKRFRLSGML